MYKEQQQKIDNVPTLSHVAQADFELTVQLR